jgi:hypothetical protein
MQHMHSKYYAGQWVIRTALSPHFGKPHTMLSNGHQLFVEFLNVLRNNEQENITTGIRSWIVRTQTFKTIQQAAFFNCNI